MDNLFEVLIYLIIIISFLSSLFKKKEQPKTTQKPERPQTTYQNNESDGFSEFESDSAQTEASGYDILSEIENIFNQELGRPKAQTESLPKQVSTANERSLEQESVNYDRFELERKAAIETQKRFQRDEIKIDSKTEKAALMFEELLNKQRAKTVIANPLIKKIKNPRMIKDYILVSEILNKPLALRK